MIFGIAFKKLLLFNFWFTPQVGPLSRNVLIIALILLSCAFLAGLIFSICSRATSFSLNKRRVYRKWYRALMTFALIGECLVLVRQYNVYVLGARFWWLILLVWLIWRGYRIVEYAERQERIADQTCSHATYSKYLPKNS